MAEDKEILNKDKQFRYKREDWAPAMRIFSEISTWIAGPIILAVIVGKYLDNRYGAGNLWLLVLSGAAFLISAYGIVKSVKQYAAKFDRNPDVKSGSRPESVGKNLDNK